MAAPDSNAASNKFDASGDAGLWLDPHERDQDNGGNANVVALDGSPAPRPAFEGQGSDAGAKLPPWVG